MSTSKSIKKSNIILIIAITLLLTIILFLLTNNSANKSVISNESNSKNNIIKFNTLTMMYETGYQSGEYQVSSDTSWPTDGYTFNEVLSKCENGSTLTWDDENKKVLMQANTSDKCYVYFDKEQIVVEIQNLDYIIYLDGFYINSYQLSSEFNLDTFYLIIDNLGEFIGYSNENGGFNFDIKGVIPNTSYNYKIYAKDKNGYSTNYWEGSFSCGRAHNNSCNSN